MKERQTRASLSSRVSITAIAVVTLMHTYAKGCPHGEEHNREHGTLPMLIGAIDGHQEYMCKHPVTST
jgi:hypothetical protein